MKRTALLLLLTTVAVAAPNQPNIIFILTDDLGWGDVGVFHQNARREHGLPAHATPNLDRMALDGARLTHHYVAAPVCVSSRSSLMQGVTQGHANVRNNQFDRAIDGNHTLGSVLHRAGYTTGAIGKWGLHGTGPGPDWPGHPLERGFDYYYGCLRHVEGHEHYPKEAIYYGEKAKRGGPIVVRENRQDVTAGLDRCYTTDLYAARAKQWIIDGQKQAPTRPFFLYLAFDTPHAVLELPTQPYPEGGGLRGGIQWLGTPGRMISTATGTPDSWVHPDYANATYDDDSNPATAEKPWPNVYRRYATSIRRIDDAVGDLLQLLRDLKIDDNTLVVFASDNGPSIESYLREGITPEFFGSFGPFDGIKRDCWEGGLRTPAIVRWPRTVPAGQVIPVPSATWDWLPTFANAAGLPAPARADGISLLPALTGRGTSAQREFLYFEYEVNGRTPNFPVFEAHHRNRLRGQMQAIRRGDYMAVRYDTKTADDPFEIYNVVDDAKEARDLGREPGFANQQAEFKRLALQARRPDPEAPRPYDAEFVPGTAVANARPGLVWQRFDIDTRWVPATHGLTASAQGTCEFPVLAQVAAAKPATILVRGLINVPQDGEYVFSLKADTGAELRLHEATVIDADADYAAGSVKRGAIRLRAGLHPMRLTYRHAAGAIPALELAWQGPGIPEQKVPAAAFRHISD